MGGEKIIRLMHESEVVKTLPNLQVVLGVYTLTLLAAGPTVSVLDEAATPVMNKLKQSLGSRFLTIGCAKAKTVNKHK
jgi:hypothetical protein